MSQRWLAKLTASVSEHIERVSVSLRWFKLRLSRLCALLQWWWGTVCILWQDSVTVGSSSFTIFGPVPYCDSVGRPCAQLWGILLVSVYMQRLQWMIVPKVVFVLVTATLLGLTGMQWLYVCAQWMQWIGIMIVVIGLGSTALGGHHHQKQQLSIEGDTVHIFVGVGITLLGCVV